MLRAADWEVATEVSFNEYGERGSIDVRPSTRTRASFSSRRSSRRSGTPQELQSTLDRKVRLAPTISRSRGWRGEAVATLLVVVDSRTNRATIARLSATFAGAFPSRTSRFALAANSGAQASDSGPLFLNTGPQAVGTQRVERPTTFHARWPGCGQNTGPPPVAFTHLPANDRRRLSILGSRRAAAQWAEGGGALGRAGHGRTGRGTAARARNETPGRGCRPGSTCPRAATSEPRDPDLLELALDRVVGLGRGPAAGPRPCGPARPRATPRRPLRPRARSPSDEPFDDASDAAAWYAAVETPSAFRQGRPPRS